uniref:Signal recognition particle subunit SRP68 n=1 Tax=Trypanosoma congolense (strain IL3000) TaxID=1068625 RepID=G0UL11_TRYCI|nr:unnamed protein product [Trypanosoma congolense IL3000]
MEFDLLLFLKEIQLQHGLRTEDYARYRRYTTNRLATLRTQLGLVQNSKKFQQKVITAHVATKPEHLQLLILCVERCWAAAEEMQEKHRTTGTAASGDAKVVGGLPPHCQFRKRLNKSVKWVEKLEKVANSVASERLQREVGAYALEVKGRTAAAHGLMNEARNFFRDAREQYYALRNFRSPEQRALIFSKVTELDDRIVFCMLRLGEDASTYKPSLGLEDDADGPGATTIEWNGRQLNVASMKVRDALRVARAVNVESTRAKALELSTPIPVGMQNRTLDLMDRRIGCLNDALAHARKDLRNLSDEKQKTELQLLVHYLIFHVSYETLQRILFMVEVHARRFIATEKCLCGNSADRSTRSVVVLPPGGSGGGGGGGKSRREIQPSQYASPLEIVRLYDAAIETLGEMEMLPGVDGRPDMEELSALCRAGKLLYLGESWRITKDADRAKNCYRGALSVLSQAPLTKSVEKLRLMIEKSALRLVSSTMLSDASGGDDESQKGQRFVPYLVDAGEEVAVAHNVVKFPPDYQAVPCKPIFVDIASTYVDYPGLESSAAAEQADDKSGEAAKGSRWNWAWGWRK